MIGQAGFQSRSEIASCTWWGARVGHRFQSFAGAERFQLGFRAGWEACLTDHADVGRLDIIYIHAGWVFGYRLAPAWTIYWGTGLGMVLGDTTPGDDNQVIPRFAPNIGPGIKHALGRHVLIDVSIFNFIFEDLGFGTRSSAGSRVSFIPNISLAIQI